MKHYNFEELPYYSKKESPGDVRLIDNDFWITLTQIKHKSNIYANKWILETNFKLNVYKGRKIIDKLCRSFRNLNDRTDYIRNELKEDIRFWKYECR